MTDILEKQTNEAKNANPLPVARAPKYPPTLMNEYHTLTDKHFSDGLSAEEAVRLLEIKDEISAIDLADPMMQVRQAAIEQLWREVEQLRQGVEALLNK